MAVIIDDTLELPGVNSDGSTVQATIGDLYYLGQRKTFRINDSTGRYTPFDQSGILTYANWRGRKIVETDENDNTIFSGIIKNIRSINDGVKGLLLIDAEEPMAQVLEWDTLSLDNTTHTGFEVDTAHTLGVTMILLKTGTTQIPALSKITFDGSVSPSYIVINAEGNPTTTITIDRPLEIELTDEMSVTVAVPKVTTGANAIKQALLSAGLDSTRIDASFDIISTEDAAYQIWLNVDTPDQINLKNYIAKISEMCNLIVICQPDGLVKLRRSLMFDGEIGLDEITSSEILPAYEYSFDDSKILIGYDLIYLKSETEVGKAIYDVSSDLINSYGGVKYFQPISVANGVKDYKFLYYDAASAEYYGTQVVDYYSHARVQVQMKLKKAYSGTIRPINASIGKQYRLTHNKYVNEPVIVTSFKYDKILNQYTELTLQLNNNPTPGIA
jgi:hypothetical protein